MTANIPPHQPLGGLATGSLVPEIHPAVAAAIASIAQHVAQLYQEAYSENDRELLKGREKMQALADKFMKLVYGEEKG